MQFGYYEHYFGIKPIMITDYLNQTDIRSICQARGFDSKCIKAKDIFLTSFSSTQGITEAIALLTEDECIFLAYMGQKVLDVSGFEHLYPKHKHRYGTYSQSYGEVFKQVWKNLVRRGLLLVTQIYTADTKLEKWRFQIPALYTAFIPAPFRQTHTIQTTVLPVDKLLRAHITELVDYSHKPLTHSLRVTTHELRIGQEVFTLDLLNQWRRRKMNEICYPKSYQRLYLECEPDVLVDVINTAVGLLKPNEFFTERDIGPLIRYIYDPKKELRISVVCQAAADLGYFSQTYHGSRVYYGRGDIALYQDQPETYLTCHNNSFVIDLHKVPYITLATLASICSFTLQKEHNALGILLATPDMICLAKQDLSLLESPLIQWMCKQSSTIQQAFDRILEKHGKILLHRNLLVAKIADLRLKAHCIKKFENDPQIKFLPNDHMVFPKSMLPLVRKCVEKSGYAVKIAPQQTKRG